MNDVISKNLVDQSVQFVSEINYNLDVKTLQVSNRGMDMMLVSLDPPSLSILNLFSG